jgi:hypothetical protein
MSFTSEREENYRHIPEPMRGRELFQKASQADELFKARLLEFSPAQKRRSEMKRIETLGESHREADEAFHRHQKFCMACAATPVAVLRYAAAE